MISRRRLIWCLFTLGVFVSPSLSSSASFYGDSYVRVPFEDASSETDIQLSFRTFRTDGLLLLAAGSPDYCIVELKAGMVRVRLDLGSGEAVLGSPPGITFDDWNWHHMHLVRNSDEVQLTIDGLYTTNTNTPGRFFELNINRGVFLGGIGGFSDVFYGNFRTYRGCLRRVQFNSINIIHGAKQQNDPLDVYGVSWDCTSEFGATSQQPISFTTNTSFAAFSSLHARREGRVSFDLRTRSETALLLYNAGEAPSLDLFSIELVDGRLKITVNKGSGYTEVSSTHVLNDGRWHQVEVLVDHALIRITIDGKRTETRTDFGANSFLDLDGFCYVGGVSLQIRAKAIEKGLQSLSGVYTAAGSLIGCMQNINLNGHLVGFHEVKVTRGLTPECVWTYPCLSSPCIDNAQCVEEGFYSYRCVCDNADTCERNPTENEGSPSVPVNNVVAAQDIVVREGGRAVLTSNHIEVLFDYAQLNIRETSIVFFVVNNPRRGELHIESAQRRENNVFTLYDLKQGRVAYIHDGSEGTTDSIGLELRFMVDADPRLPKKLRQNYGFTLIVKVAPWNDKPTIRLPEDETLVLVANTEVKITQRILKAQDRDDPPESLEYSIQYPKAFDIGYFEITDNLGVRARITSFTQSDVNEGKIKYIHRGALEVEIRIQVSDGKDISDPHILYVSAVPLTLTLQVNTGLVIHPGATQLILRDNLTFISNAPNQDIDIRFEVTDPPYHGEIQRQQYADNQWVVSTTFAQRHIDKSRLRYVHYGQIAPAHIEDYFKFKVVAMDVQTQEYTFRVRLHAANVQLQRNSELLLSGVRDGRITNKHLRALSSVGDHSPRDIIYTIVVPPEEGNVVKIEEKNDQQKKKRLGANANFTQDDINKNKIMFRLHKALFTQIVDSFQFRVSVPGHRSILHEFSIRYEPEEGEVTFINNGLTDVLEGGSKVVKRDELYMETATFKEFRYTIISGPYHGVLHLIDPTSGQMEQVNISSFTNKNIRENHVVYLHDDSEHDEDSFTFTATPINDQPDFLVLDISEFSGTFDIKIMLRNDNVPKRVVEKVLNVVANRGRVITTEDIMYKDPDVDFDSSELRYIFEDLQNGQIVKADNHSWHLTEFYQKDLEAGKIYFMHKGPDYGRSVVRVTDEHYYTMGLFEVQASEPYIHFANNTGISVQRGQISAISTTNLSIETNLDVEDKDVRFIIHEAPMYGKIKKNNQERSRFSLADMKNGMIFYEHEGGVNFQDSFKFTVKVENIPLEGSVKIRVLSESHTDPPHIINNNVITVDENSLITITDQDLQVSHPETQPMEIQYTITRYPQFGMLMIRDGLDGENLRMFTQADVNQGLLMFKHTEKGAESDTFMFDVTNGIQSLHGLEFVIEIIPKLIPLEIRDFAVMEGDHKMLTDDIVTVQSKHFMGDPLSFLIVKEPVNGWIESRNHPGVPVLRFTQKQLQSDYIYYVHNGSDTLTDSFAIMAKSGRSIKKSNPHTINIEIIPTNDQPPRVVVNNPLHVWTGSVSPITSEHLKVVDLDSTAEELMYIISNPNNGDLALKMHLERTIQNFTQAHIDKGEVVFVHREPNEGQFDFTVNDGVNFAKKQTFHIQARPLTLELTNNAPLEVYPGIIQPVTTSHLLAKTNDDNQTQTIVYTINTKSEHGRLVWVTSNGTMIEAHSFTQRDVDVGSIAYHFTQSLSKWIETDSFMFEVSTAYARSVKEQTFQVSISYENVNDGNIDQLIHIGRVEVEEGATVQILAESLDAGMMRRKLRDSGLRSPDVSYILSALPMYGELKVDGGNVTEGDSFTQRDINKGKVTYEHDHSDSLWDAFEFYVQVEVASGLDGERSDPTSRFSNVFNITVSPINDQPFTVVTKSPELKLVQGFTANITRDQLFTTDPDTPPEGLSYVIMNQPNNGYIVMASDPDVPIEEFTQKDIDDNVIMFIQDGSMESGAFYLRISDGKFEPFFKVVNVIVEPLTLELVNTSDIKIDQGRSSTFVTDDNFGVITNGRVSKVIYNVTVPPKFGQLYMHESVVYQFSHKNVEDGEVTYIQTDLSSYWDSFEFILYDSQNMVTNQRVNITVVPKVKQKPASAPGGEDLVLTTNDLDAGELAASTGSNPNYTILNEPRFGKLFKIQAAQRAKRNADEMDDHREKRYTPKNKRDSRKKKVQSFTHQDIVEGTIKYVPNKDGPNREQRDSFTYLLTADNVQPAKGVYYINVKPSQPKPEDKDEGQEGPSEIPRTIKPEKTTEGYTPPTIGANKEVNDTGSQVSTDHLIIIILVSGVTVIAILILIITKCLRKRQRQKQKQQLEAAKEDSRTPLAQPHMQIEPNRQLHTHDEGSEEDEDSERSAMLNGGPRIPKINITSDSVSGSARSLPRSRSPSPTRRGPRSHQMGDIQADPGLPPKYVKPQQPTPQASIEDYSDRTVPMCKVTPLSDDEDADNKTPGGTLKRQVKFDWESIDPELLQHCRTTNPVLHENKYWV